MTGTPAEQAFDTWYEADYDFRRSLTESPHDAIRRAFLAAYDLGRREGRSESGSSPALLRVTVPPRLARFLVAAGARRRP